MSRLEAPAKLTLSLTITGVRDDGYHLIEAEMVALDLCDVLVIDRSTRTTITVDGRYADGVPTDGSNLVHRALELVGTQANVALTKNIPHGGGLGGGSTDAAAVLRWAGWNDASSACRIGADVPFCMVGGRAIVTGIGEVVEPVTFEPRDFTLVIPPVHVPTPLAYRTWDQLGSPTGDNGNDLEPAALAAVPELRRWRDLIESVTGVRPHLAGSGATWFLDGHFQGLDVELAGAQVVHTSTRADDGRAEGINL